MKKLILVLLVFPGGVFGGWFGPDTYDECLLKYLPEAKTNGIASEIKQSCRNKFPVEKVEVKRPESRMLTKLELSKLKQTVKAPYLLSDLIKSAAYVYNGNTNITITNITISYTEKKYGEYITRRHEESMTIRQGEEDMIFGLKGIDNKQYFTWEIIEAKGY